MDKLYNNNFSVFSVAHAQVLAQAPTAFLPCCSRLLAESDFFTTTSA